MVEYARGRGEGRRQRTQKAVLLIFTQVWYVKPRAVHALRSVKLQLRNVDWRVCPLENLIETDST